MNGLYRAVGGVPRADNSPTYCDACFSGEYPIPLTDRDGGDNSAQLSLLAELS
jgi:amidophosphoribosyltransferase